MMILHYEISDPLSVDPERLAVADEAQWRYDLVLGNIIFESTPCDFSARWGWVPLVDFALAMKDISSNLIASGGAQQRFEFTESDATIAFERFGNDVKIQASYAPQCMARVAIEDFGVAVETLLTRLTEDLKRRCPHLRQNQAFQKLVQTD